MAVRVNVSPAPIQLDVLISQKDLDRVAKRLDKWKGQPLAVRLQKVTGAGIKLFVPRIKGNTPRGETGNLQRSVGSRKLRSKGRPEIAAYAAGPVSRRGGQHRHLVIQGHDIVGHRPNMTTTGKRTRPNPFVDEAVKPIEGQVIRFMSEQVRRLA